MKQVDKYEVIEQGFRGASMLDGNDAILVNSYPLGIQSFDPEESRLDVIIYNQDGVVLDHQQDVSDYTILGVEQGPHKVNQLVVDPTVYYQDRTYLGDIVVEYQAFNNLYSRGAELFVFDISSDRTEIRAKSLVISTSDLRYYTQVLQDRLNNQSYFSEAYLEALGEKYAIINATTEVINGALVATFKLYKALPEAITLRTPFQVLESLGESRQFLVRKSTVVVEEPPVELRGPNFDVKVEASTNSTSYKNYLELLSQKSWESSKELYTTFKKASQHVSVNYEDFSQFVHFSSAFERLENARYKFELIFQYQAAQEEAATEEEAQKYVKLIEGIIENFDHYENFLYFEYSPVAWPKKVDLDGKVIRPYENVTNPLEYEDWYNDLLAKAEAYDLSNKDILVSTIPVAIREDVDNNEPYIMFIHMIGQHFDDLWIYARAISDRYKADNRPEFGISKELVKDAIETFGLDLYETDQNLNRLFELTRPDGTHDVGTETYVQMCATGSEDPVKTLAEGQEPARIETYTKEVYKRIYHNIPTLVKTRGTSRGLRVLLNCFGIPNSVLKFKVQGGTNPENRPFFGPEEVVDISEAAGVNKVRAVGDVSTTFEEYTVVDGTGSFYTSSVLSRYVPITASAAVLTDDSHKAEVGFDLNEAVNQYIKQQLSGSDFTVDDVIGDPRNRETQYGDAWKNIRNQILEEAHTGGKDFRAPAAIIRFVRYFDTTFFRMLQDFLPARASIDSAVIVKDNILHRNRWEGVDVGLEELSMSGSTTGSRITGSDGGSFDYAGERFDTGTGSNLVANPDRGWVEKPVISGSREFTGELAGTEFKTLTGDGDLSQYNTHRKNTQPSNHYDYVVWFLDLPDPPLCGCGITSQSTFGLYSIKAVGGPAEVQVNGTSQAISSGATKYFAGENYSGGTIQNTQWTPGSRSSKIFAGICSGSSTSSLGSLNPSSKFVFGNIDYADGRLFAVYASASKHYILWSELVKPYGPAYSDRDFVISWKYLPSGSSPKTNDPHQTSQGTPWGGTDPINFTVTLTNGTRRTINMPASVTFGAVEGWYYWADITGSNAGINLNGQYGVSSLVQKTSPFVSGNVLVDATWFANYSDWYIYLDPTNTNNYRWEFKSGSTIF